MRFAFRPSRVELRGFSRGLGLEQGAATHPPEPQSAVCRLGFRAVGAGVADMGADHPLQRPTSHLFHW